MSQNHDYINPISTLTTWPSPVAKTGTVTSSGKIVRGTGTTFLTEVKEGDWLWDPAQAEIQEVQNVNKNSELLALRQPFTLDLAAVALVIVPRSISVDLSFVNTGVANGMLDGQILVPGQIVFWDKSSLKNRGSKSGYIDPAVIDGTGTTISVETLR